MLAPQQLAEAYARNAGIIRMQTDGLTHADSVLQPPFRANCLNWVLGHILEGRNNMTGLLGLEPAFDPARAVRYARGSEPILGDEPGIVPLEDLLAMLASSQTRLDGRLCGLSDEEFGQEITFIGRPMTLDQALFFIYFHETYHTGQAEPLRQLAGKNDQVI